MKTPSCIAEEWPPTWQALPTPPAILVGSLAAEPGAELVEARCMDCMSFRPTRNTRAMLKIDLGDGTYTHEIRSPAWCTSGGYGPETGLPTDAVHYCRFFQQRQPRNERSRT